MLYVPGLLPKPEASVHRQALLRCLLSGLERVDATVAAGFNVECHFLIVSKAGETCAFDCADVDKYVLTTSFILDEAKAFS